MEESKDRSNQFWDSVSGEEYTIIDPRVRLDISVHLQTMWPAQVMETQDTCRARDLSTKIQPDPFETLPYDVTWMIFSNLSIEDTLALMKASYHVSHVMHTDVWRALIWSKFLPWFPEFRKLYQELLVPGNINCKKVFLWLENITKPRIGIRGPLMGIANRRRIWRVCEQIGMVYNHYAMSNELETNEILEQATTLTMAPVMYPLPVNSEPSVISQWIKSWDEIEQKSCDFITYWHDTGSSKAGGLVGLGVAFGDDERVFNHPRGASTTVAKVTLENSDWIQVVVLHIEDIFEPEPPASKGRHALIDVREQILIRGVTITMRSGIQYDLCAAGTIPFGLTKRILTASKSHEIVGLKGRIASEFELVSLTVLQCPRRLPTTESSPSFQSDIILENVLWAHQAAQLPSPESSPSSTKTVPAWLHPSMAVQPFPYPGFDRSPMPMVKREILLWANEPAAYRNLVAISACRVKTGLPFGVHVYNDIIGLRAEFIENGELNYREIGTGEPVPSIIKAKRELTFKGHRRLWDRMSYLGPWHADNTERFEIDGKNGEVVTAMYVGQSGNDLRLKTNKGRQCTWRASDDKVYEEWYGSFPEEDRMIVGIMACFATGSNDFSEKKGHSHLMLSAATIVTMPVDQEL
ncbi:unnamed protein product [Periconia digitata]|uniref:F-box domain-containing protein n=1 Tax=Periconia digitata TaxID=1303443 RepID=A0A9W4USI2_9PLEO|nr:unnamed protein product [Periconia digitata]